jgi:hypothetical protein
MVAASAHLTRQEPIEAMQFLDAVAAIDNQYPGLQEAYGQVRASTPASLAMFQSTWLGVNRPPRYPVERGTAQKVLLYLPDRLVDLLDCATFDVHFGPGAYVNGHVTRAAQLGGGVRAVWGFGTYGARSIVGTRWQSAAGLSFLNGGLEAQAGAQASAAGFRTVTQTKAGMYYPTDAYYQSFADFWEAGFSATFGAFGFDMDLHPVQVADALAGFAMVDFLSDDWATSRALNIGRRESELVRQVLAIGGSTKAREQYAEWIRAQRNAGTAPVREPTSESSSLD